MDSNSASNSFLFSELREGREGVQFERILRGLTFILYQWCQYKGNRKPLYGETEAHSLSVIQFDKLAMFMFRIWNEMYRQHGKAFKPSTENPSPSDAQKLVTFPSPFIELPGKHGRGPARYNGQTRPIYIIETLYSLQNEGIHYFDIIPPVEAPDDPKDHRTTISSGMTITDPNQFLSDFTSYEIEILKDIGNSLKRLGPSEIRALGTHENHRKTVEDIAKEFRDMSPHRRGAINKIRSGEQFLTESREMLEYADEAWRKSKANRKDYNDACGIMLKELSTPETRAAFTNCQASAERIWDPQPIPSLGKESQKALAVTKYLHAIALLQNQDTDKSTQKTGAQSKRISALWTEGLEEMQNLGYKEIPSEISDVLVGGTITPTMQTRLTTLIESIEL